MNRLALAAAIVLALTVTPSLAWDDEQCREWDKTHPKPHPDCVQATPTPNAPTATSVPPTQTPTPHGVTPTPNAPSTSTPQPTSTRVPTPPTPIETSSPTPTPTVSQECIPCGEADAPTPMPPLGPAGPNSPAVLAAVVEIAPAVEPQAMPVQVLAAGPAMLPTTGTPLPYVASLLLGLGMTVGGWLMRRGS